jgi:hypothetical protein
VISRSFLRLRRKGRRAYPTRSLGAGSIGTHWQYRTESATVALGPDKPCPGGCFAAPPQRRSRRPAPRLCNGRDGLVDIRSKGPLGPEVFSSAQSLPPPGKRGAAQGRGDPQSGTDCSELVRLAAALLVSTLRRFIELLTVWTRERVETPTCDVVLVSHASAACAGEGVGWCFTPRSHHQSLQSLRSSRLGPKLRTLAEHGGV